MISLILYGRNDNYGYNLHKRAALSLNCMAEVLTDPDDEILFVDYNTPDDFPTFPEAIFDTLTERARRKLRILRVRTAVHDKYFGDRTHLKALEPVSRNVAVRRSNPNNRWVLSTNTDMIFVPHIGHSLSEAVSNLPKGFYCAPRLEIPETLWEGFDRLDPAGVISETREIGEALHLNEIIKGDPHILYDGPGDFQLIERQDLFDFHGFDEDMLLGWHVDSNISRRLVCHYGKVSDAAPFVFGYHCDHTRQVTPMHKHNSVQNDLQRFVCDVNAPSLPQQAQSWGLADVDIEEASLTSTVSSAYRKALAGAITTRLETPTEVYFNNESYDRERASPEHVLPFLLDVFSSFPRNGKVAWLGQTDRMFDLFSRASVSLGLTQAIPVVTHADDNALELENVDAFIINFGMPVLAMGEEEAAVRRSFVGLLAAERRRFAKGLPLRRIVAVNAIHNRFESFVTDSLAAVKAPFSTRLRQGFANPDAFSISKDWTGDMRPGDKGSRRNGSIVSVGSSGTVAFGPYSTLFPGNYLVKLDLTCRPWEDPTGGLKALFSKTKVRKDAMVEIEVVLNDLIKNKIRVPPSDGTIEIPLAISLDAAWQQIQIRLMNFNMSVELRSVVVDLD